ncbi:hypothetical protein EVAR_28622_1 [Eumeta japonica]|uniref:Mariner Mos1 transposase n=1 Tax=Eumeta variegata TaxID=151549 RepID=A0A4C1XX75_EUMVA|nr:hypothetical protein EVAR_28622_1 [Eumeta japonica]
MNLKRHEHLAVGKLCTRWIAHNLTIAQKLRRVDCYRKTMQRLAGGNSNAVYNIITSNERWIRCYDPETIDSLIDGRFLSKSYLLKKTRSKRQKKDVQKYWLIHLIHLASCGFYLFPKIKEKLRGMWLTDAEEAVTAYENTVEMIAKCE